LKDYLLLVVYKIGKEKYFLILFFFLYKYLFISEEWITALEIINRQTTPHLQHQLPTTKMVTNDDIDNTENEYPAMNEIFSRRPVR
jgi:hypothetical protein